MTDFNGNFTNFGRNLNPNICRRVYFAKFRGFLWYRRNLSGLVIINVGFRYDFKRKNLSYDIVNDIVNVKSINAEIISQPNQN